MARYTKKVAQEMIRMNAAREQMEKAQAVKLNATAAVLSESATLSMVLHPFVANKFCSLQTPSHLILVLEMCTSGDFYDVLKRDGHFQPAAVKVALCHLLLALEHLHGAGIVHRDLKPENLLLNDRGHTKLTDFGFAKSVRFRTFTLCGTPEYMSPEQVSSQGHGVATDLWALGVLLFELKFPADYLRNVGSHSLKATVLSWAAKYGIGKESQRALGYHAAPGDHTMAA